MLSYKFATDKKYSLSTKGADFKEKNSMDYMCQKPHPTKRSTLLPLVILFVLSITFSFAADTEKGEKLFKQNCASCHSIGDNKVIGPGLKGIMDRVPKPADAWLVKWVKNSKALINSGDAYAVKVFNDNGKVDMPAQAVSDEEIKAIFEYVQNPPVKKETTPEQSTGTSTQKENGSPTLVIVIGLLLLALFFTLRAVQKSLGKVVREKAGLPEPVKYEGFKGVILWMRTHKKWVAVILLFLAGWGSRAAWNGMYEIGVYQGYMPEQPIFFSHKIHAGQNGINCVYCHSSVEKGKVSGVPSVNVCMNCHKSIQEGAVTGKTEIAKIYTAADYDVNTQKYGPNPKPIKWIRVHNLPDFAYFNHSQHVKVGQQDCANCHGPVATMDTIRQVSKLTMGWCIDCHNKTEVKMEGNKYYEELHAKLKEKYKNQPITVSKMGGIECGKCHY